MSLSSGVQMMPSDVAGLLQTAAAGNCQIRLPLISRKYSTALRLQISAERRCTLLPGQISGKYNDCLKDWLQCTSEGGLLFGDVYYVVLGKVAVVDHN